jgi:glycosyltransferase involved in cell wall biosynthesis/ribosomal protein S18 acetylase RimI-like enzyme
VSAPKVAHVTTVDLSLRFLLLPQLCGLRDSGFEVTSISSPGPWVGDLETQGIRHIPWRHATRAWDPGQDALAFAELFGIFRRERFDLVHTHTPKAGVLGRIAARSAGVPCVANTVHGFWAAPEHRLRRRVPVMTAEWIASRFSDLELYVSTEDLAWARRLRVARPGRAGYLAEGVDLSQFRPGRVDEERSRKLKAELGIHEDELVVGTVGRMVREKGYAELFEAARTVRASVPNVRFLAVGQGDSDKPDVVKPDDLGSSTEDFVFTGWREDVADLLALMDVFVLPSWREGLPRSVIEAAATGLPLVVTDIRGCREIVRDGVEGFLVPVRDPVRLADAIARILQDPVLRRRMGVAARARAEERFDERRVVAALVGSTRRLLVAAGRLPVESPGRVQVRRARQRDAAAMARLHRESLPAAFLPALGDGFLKRLYRAAAKDDDAVALVAVDRGRVVGFAVAAPSIRAFYRRFARREGLAAGIAAAPHLFRTGVLRRVIETARYPSEDAGLPEAELLSIAVDGSRRSHGVGGALAEAVASGLADRNVREFKVVVNAANEGAGRFYERLGFRLAAQTAVHAGAASNVWVTTCPS